MKKTFYILTMAASVMLVSCGGEKEEEKKDEKVETTENQAAAEEAPVVEEVEVEEAASVVGTWQAVSMDLGMEIPEEQQAEMEQAIQEQVAQTKYTFGEDGTMTMVSGLGTETGSYTAGESSIETTINGRTESVNIVELSATTLVLGVDEEGMTMTITLERE